MLSSTNEEKGRLGVIIDNGCLFRSGRELKIRKAVLKENLVESVILLPEKLFYNTGAPGAIIVFNKNKAKNRKNKILFINASFEYKKHPEVRKLNILGKENIEHIRDIYKNFEEKEGLSRVVDLDEIKENDYNLNVTLYVFPEEEIEEIDIDKEWGELKEVESEIDKVEEKIKGYLEEMK
jgi:type I restriction enzyme M protein